jgi:hypothetical protein
VSACGQGLVLIHLMSNSPEGRRFILYPKVVAALIGLWDSPARACRLRCEEHLLPGHVLESRWIVESLLNTARAARDDPSVLWRILSMSSVRTLIDFSFLMDFFRVELPNTYTAVQKKTLVRDFLLRVFDDKKIAAQHKVKALKLVIIPMLSATFKPATTSSATAGATGAAADSKATAAGGGGSADGKSSGAGGSSSASGGYVFSGPKWAHPDAEDEPEPGAPAPTPAQVEAKRQAKANSKT